MVLDDFSIKQGDLFAAMTDGGSDVVWMATKGLSLLCEWCVAHLTNATAKFAFGLEPTAKSRNQEMTKIVDDLQRTIKIVKSVEMVGTQFEALCQMENSGKSTKLIDYRAHRFRSIARCVEQVLERWTPVEKWSEQCATSGRQCDKAYVVFHNDNQ